MLKDVTNVSQLSSNELISNKVYNSSSNTIFIDESWFIILCISFRCSSIESPSLYFKFTNFQIKNALLPAVFLSYKPSNSSKVSLVRFQWRYDEKHYHLNQCWVNLTTFWSNFFHLSLDILSDLAPSAFVGEYKSLQ